MKDIEKSIRQKQSIKNIYRLVRSLLNQGFTKPEILDAFKDNLLKIKKRGNNIGTIYVVYSLILLFFIHGTIGSFRYEFSGAADFYRLNEWMLKPFLSVSFLLVGTGLLINKGFYDQVIKYFLLGFCLLFAITGVIGNSLDSLVLSILGAIILLFTKIYPERKISDEEYLFKAIENEDNIINVSRQLESKNWEGSYLALILLFCAVLLMSSLLKITALSAQDQSFFNLDKILGIIFRLLLIGLVISGIFLHFRKNKLIVKGVIVASCIYIILSLFSEYFQPSIFPCIIVIIFGTIDLLYDSYELPVKGFSLITVIFAALFSQTLDYVEKNKNRNEARIDYSSKSIQLMDRIDNLSTDDFVILKEKDEYFHRDQFKSLFKVEDLNRDSVLLLNLSASQTLHPRDFYKHFLDSTNHNGVKWFERNKIKVSRASDYDSLNRRLYTHGTDFFIKDNPLFLKDVVRIEPRLELSNSKLEYNNNKIKVEIFAFGNECSLVKIENLKGNIHWTSDFPIAILTTSITDSFVIEGNVNSDSYESFEFILHFANEVGKELRYKCINNNDRLILENLNE